jgi:2-polyprenyl-6-methoxyphenol hydroxylase-like FAD-dependent oxidoreductase
VKRAGNDSYDIVTVGGGLGGAALAKAMAQAGARVLVLERESKFKDRVRGEVMMPWGVAEAKSLGIYDLLRREGRELSWWKIWLGEVPFGHRNLVETTPQAAPAVAFLHPAAQESLLAAAEQAGAEVRRRAKVRSVEPGAPVKVVFQDGASGTEVRCRLVAGADGRESSVRRWAGFDVRNDPDFLWISGILLDDVPAEEDAMRINPDFGGGKMSVINPQGGGRVRSYLVSRVADGLRLQGEGDVQKFIDESVAAGVPAELYARAKPSGPLATFRGADSYVEHPYRDGVALVGDAAATSDPTWGQGLSLTMRDARVLRDALLADDDWERAGHAYAAEHDRYYGIDRQVSNWQSELFFTPGPEADARRARAFGAIAQDNSRMPDANLSGPDIEVDESTRKVFFGEE